MTALAPPAAFRFAGLRDDRLIHGVSGRHGGVSRQPFESLNLSVKTGDDQAAIEQNRRLFERLMSIESRQVAFGKLSHGRDVTIFRLGGLIPSMTPPNLGWPMFDSDAAISNIPGLILVMTFADCVPVLLWDEDRSVCALAHAGWRGTSLRIASTTVEAMVEAFDVNPKTVWAGIGPSIGQQCYPVGAHVREAFEASYGRDAGQFFEGDNVDLWAANRFDLTSAGVDTHRIELSGVCTACNTDQYFSYRAENGTTGRFGACIGLRYLGRFAPSDQG